MPRGRQYYDPIVQHPASVQGDKDLARIELYPEGAADDPNPKWRARRINGEGQVVGHTGGDFDHDRALAQAQVEWANLPVYELRSEGEDSTWEGVGPSPRLWQSGGYSEGIPAAIPPAVEPAQEPEYGAVHAVMVDEPGHYVLLSDILLVLEGYAKQYDEMNNPSGGVALRDAAHSIKAAF